MNLLMWAGYDDQNFP